MEFITTVWYKSWTGDKGHSLLHTQEDHNPHKLIHTSRWQKLKESPFGNCVTYYLKACIFIQE